MTSQYLGKEQGTMIIIVFCWMILIVWGMKCSKQKNALEQKQAIALRGICAIEIMLGHIGLATESIILFPNRKAGLLFVGIFFALSGYGLMYSVKNKENYLRGFLIKRIPKILIPAYAVFLIGVLVKSIVAGNANNLVNAISVRSFFLQTNWYVWELLGLYIVFFICGKIDATLLKSQYIVYGTSIVFVSIAFVLGLDNPWYGSTLCFGLGIFYYIKEEAFEKFWGKHILLKILIFSILLMLSCVLFFVKKGIVGNLIARNCASVLFTLLVLSCLQKCSIGNVVSYWCGKYAYEIFLFHPLCISVLREWIQSDVLYAATVIGTSLLASFIYRSCADLVKSLLKKMVVKREK